jgi:hypothetical protein
MFWHSSCLYQFNVMAALNKKQEEKMKIQEIRKLGKAKGVKAVKLKKTDIIQLIQRAEGNFDCYGTAYSGYCDQFSCLWREDCFTLHK